MPRSIHDAPSGRGLFAAHRRLRTLLAEKRSLNETLESLGDIHIRVAQDGRILRVTPAVERMLGYSAKEALTLRAWQLWAEPSGYDELVDLIATRGTLYDFTTSMKRKDGGIVTISFSGCSILDPMGRLIGADAILRDISERNRALERTRTSLKEKEVLLKETHHRVKNNLQVIISLLNLQSDAITDSRMVEIFRESQGRIATMALVHEEIYNSASIALVGFKRYVESLLSKLARSYPTTARIKSIVRIDDALALPEEKAIPCGLILNELFSNALKHAFHQREEGRIEVGVSVHGDCLFIEVADNGVGFPGDLDWRACPSLGLQLVTTLARQLDAQVELKREKGTRIIIRGY